MRPTLSLWPRTGRCPAAARLLREHGFTAPILGGDGFDSGARWQQYGELDNIYFTTHAYLGADNPNPTVQAFRAAYLASHPDGDPDAFTALGYDAAKLLLTAIATAQSSEPAAVRAALTAITDFDGVTGRISYAPGSPIPNKSVTILAVAEGAIAMSPTSCRPASPRRSPWRLQKQ
ncbi:MAG: ABC transporter substrate-binding protein [Caldilineaceae bacterium]